VIPSGARVVHASVDADIIARIVPTDVGIVATVDETATQLRTALESLATAARLDGIRALRAKTVGDFTRISLAAHASLVEKNWDANPLRWERVAGELDRLLEPDAIVVSELTQRRWETAVPLPESAIPQLTGVSQFTFGPGAKMRIGKSTGGALGWGIGAAIGVKLARPDRQVVALQGDGSFLFGQAETLWTMARYEVPIIVVVFNNRGYNGPRNQIFGGHSEQMNRGTEMTCYLGNPDVDFAKLAAAFGVKGETVTAPDQLKAAITRAIESTRAGRPYLIDAAVARSGAGADSRCGTRATRRRRTHEEAVTAGVRRTAHNSASAARPPSRRRT
jgi:thiamine pyrophosphate-dependent acetolactate synthase large subunit-like protein